MMNFWSELLRYVGYDNIDDEAFAFLNYPQTPYNLKQASQMCYYYNLVGLLRQFLLHPSYPNLLNMINSLKISYFMRDQDLRLMRISPRELNQKYLVSGVEYVSQARLEFMNIDKLFGPEGYGDDDYFNNYYLKEALEYCDKNGLGYFSENEETNAPWELCLPREAWIETWLKKEKKLLYQVNWSMYNTFICIR